MLHTPNFRSWLQNQADLAKIAIVAPTSECVVDLAANEHTHRVRVPEALRAKYLVVSLSTLDGSITRVVTYTHCSAQVCVPHSLCGQYSGLQTD